MALPPINTTTPAIAKTATGAQARPVQEEKREDKAKAAEQKDSVSISEAALKKIDEIQSTEKARETAQDVRKDLEKNTQVRLGRDKAA